MSSSGWITELHHPCLSHAHLKLEYALETAIIFALPLPVSVSLILNFTSKGPKVDISKRLSMEKGFTSLTVLPTVPWQNTPKKYPGLALNMKRDIR